jgi:hypothetical protein
MLCQSQEKLKRIKSSSALAAEKIVLVQAQYDALQAQIKINMVSKDQEGTSGVTHDNPHSSEESAGGKPFQTAWEKWCNAKYGTKDRKIMYDPSNFEEFPNISRDNLDPAPLSNLNCRSQREILMIFQKWNAWAKTQKSIFKNRVTWSDLTLRLTWGFTGNIELWWEILAPIEKMKIMEAEKPLEELIRVVAAEFYGNALLDEQLPADLFMKQKLCDISQLPEFFCTMQDLLYQTLDPDNTAYIRKYLVAMSGRIPDLVRETYPSEVAKMDELSLAGMQELIVKSLQKACLQRKIDKYVQK